MRENCSKQAQKEHKFNEALFEIGSKRALSEYLYSFYMNTNPKRALIEKAVSKAVCPLVLKLKSLHRDFRSLFDRIQE